jgi:uncharacterized membrane protein (Fun14 family)
MAQLIGLYIVAAISIGIGVVVVARRNAFAALNRATIRTFFPKPLGERPSSASTPRLFLTIGIVALVLGTVTLVLAILVSAGVMELK